VATAHGSRLALLLYPIAPARLVPDGGLIIDAGAGDGRLTRPLVEAGYRVHGIELHARQHDRGLPIEAGIDFLALTPFDSNGPAAIVMNPPYGRSLMNGFLRHAMALLPEGGELHALMRHASMTAEDRAYLLPSLKRIVMCGRLNMLPHDREHEDKGHETQCDFSWFTFTKGRTAGATAIIHAVVRA